MVTLIDKSILILGLNFLTRHSTRKHRNSDLARNFFTVHAAKIRFKTSSMICQRLDTHNGP